MKFKHLFISTLLLGGAMASCSDDLDVDKGGQILENETTTYVRVSLMGEAAEAFGRADETEPGYEFGLDGENKVNRVILTFFDAGRNFVGSTELKSTDLEKDDVEIKDQPGNTVARMITFVAQVNLPQNINYPRYVMAYVNPTTKANDLTTEKLEDVMRYIRERAEISPEGFTMNNSVYFSTTSGNSRFATEVDFNTQFFGSREEALAADKATIEITVERVEAKVRVSSRLDEINIEDYRADRTAATVTTDDYVLRYVPEAWFVNATEKRSWLIKNYRSTRQNFTASIPNTTAPDFGYTLNELAGYFSASGQTVTGTGSSIRLNDSSRKRSYWAISPTYFYEVDGKETTYPDVSYEVEYGDINTAEKNEFNSLSVRNYPLNYISYNDGVKSYSYNEGQSAPSKYIGYNNNRVKTHEYVLENTQSISTLRGTDAKAAMTSVVVLGHYEIYKNGVKVFDGASNANKVPDTDKVFYVRHEASGTKVIIVDEENGKSDDKAIDYFLERLGSVLYVQQRDKATGEYYKDENGNDVFVPVSAATLDENLAADNKSYGLKRSDFKLVYPEKTVTNGIVQSEQWRTLALKQDAAGKVNDELLVSLEGRYVKLNDVIAGNGPEGAYKGEWDNFLVRLYSASGVLEKFQAGKAYFNVPLKHIWSDLTSKDNAFNSGTVRLGDYGVVRNHVYDLTINKIGGGLGTGIGDVDQPIVPPTENEQYYISTRLNILKWRVVGQSVDL